MPEITHERPDPQETAERVRLMRDGLLNYLPTVISGLVSLVLVPILLTHLNLETYGLWIAAVAVAGTVRMVDFGLAPNITRQVAIASGNGARDAYPFVRAAAGAFTAIGVLGAVLVSLIGFPMRDALGLSGDTRAAAPAVFFLVGFTLFHDQLFLFSAAVLQGLRRFGSAAFFSLILTLTKGAGTVAVLWAGKGVISVAAWQALATAGCSWAIVRFVARQPGFHWRPGWFDWTLLRKELRFGLGSQLANLAGSFARQMPPLLIGVISGSAAVVPYHIGQRFPLAVSGFTRATANALFPAASQAHERGGAEVRAIVETGTRWLLMTALPLTIVFILLAPSILHVWIGTAPAATLPVFRILAGAVLAEALGAGALNVLWGAGRVGTVLAVLSAQVVVSFALSLTLLTRIGIVGPAWGIFLPAVAGSLALLATASRVYRTGFLAMLSASSRGLLFPSLACAASVLGLSYLLPPAQGFAIILIAMVSGFIYLGSLYGLESRGEERKILREIGLLPVRIVRTAFRRTGGVSPESAPR